MKKLVAATLALVLAGSCLAAWTKLHSRTGSWNLLGKHRKNLPESTGTLLCRAGLTPESMAAAGCTLEHVNNIIDLMSVKAQVPGFVDDLEAATAALNERLNQHIRPLVPEGQNAPPPGPVVDTASVNERQDAVDALLDDAFSFATTGLPSAQRSLLASIRANRRWSGMPAPYLVVERTPAEHYRLRQALTATAQAARGGRIQPDGAGAIIAQAGDDPVVTASLAAYADQLEAIGSLWNQRVEQPQ